MTKKKQEVPRKRTPKKRAVQSGQPLTPQESRAVQLVREGAIGFESQAQLRLRMGF